MCGSRRPEGAVRGGPERLAPLDVRPLGGRRSPASRLSCRAWEPDRSDGLPLSLDAGFPEALPPGLDDKRSAGLPLGLDPGFRAALPPGFDDERSDGLPPGFPPALEPGLPLGLPEGLPPGWEPALPAGRPPGFPPVVPDVFPAPERSMPIRLPPVPSMPQMQQGPPVGWPLLKVCPAASYSPTQSPAQYHRR